MSSDEAPDSAIELPASVEEFVRDLTEIELLDELWLFGSRANDEARDDSDWDFVAAGTEGLLDKIRSQLANPERLDIDLFVHDKKGWCLSAWEKERKVCLHDWTEQENGLASYVRYDWVPDTVRLNHQGGKTGEKESVKRVALRIYPQPNSRPLTEARS